jgi:hypothetical protein
VRRVLIVLCLSLSVACGGGKPAASPADSIAAMQRADDSVLAMHKQLASALADSARTALASLLKRPESAVFDSVVVVQQPKDDGRWPAPVVCGRINGKPGIGGQSAPAPFIYQSRINVFVLDPKNGDAFRALRMKSCDNPAATILIK